MLDFVFVTLAHRESDRFLGEVDGCFVAREFAASNREDGGHETEPTEAEQGAHVKVTSELRRGCKGKETAPGSLMPASKKQYSKQRTSTCLVRVVNLLRSCNDERCVLGSNYGFR